MVFRLFSNDLSSLNDYAVSLGSNAVSYLLNDLNGLVDSGVQRIYCISSSGLVASACCERHCHSGNEHKCNLFHFLF